MKKRVVNKEEKQVKKTLKNNKGITLIALVITIIVLLILAGVTIATLTGKNGILTRASDASRVTEIASVKEQAQLDIADWVAEKLKNREEAIIDSYEDVKKILDEANPDEGNRYYREVKEEGIETPNGYIVPIEELYILDSGSGSGEGETTSKTVEDLVAGEWVYYDTGDTSIGEQGLIKCIVLYDKTYNETEGTNYGIQIISADIVGDEITLGDDDFNISTDSYNNAITTLNGKAEKYLNEKDKTARPEIAIDARCVGSVPDNKNSESGIYENEYDYMSSYTFRDDDDNYVTDYIQMQALGIKKAKSGDYWFASRHKDCSASQCRFGIMSMMSSANVPYAGNYICFVNDMLHFEEGLPVSYALRPVFTLKSGIKVIEGDGSEDKPYKLES